MKHINTTDIKLPPDWELKAKKVVDELFAESDPVKRKKIIQGHSSLWSELKDALEELSHGKCWYCESEQNRSDYAVDHFRPKGKVAECKDHGGYWWLAFDWKNYRLSCTFCNSVRIDAETGDSGGKQDHFPVADEHFRAKSFSDDISLEQPGLLDPTNPHDPGLLWYDYSEGRAVPKYGKDVDAIRFGRADVSIRLYHLNHTKIEEKRKVLYNELMELLNRGSDALDHISKYSAKDAEVAEYAKRNMSFVLRRLRDLLSPKAELSAVTRAYLITLVATDLTGRFSWVKKTLLTE